MAGPTKKLASNRIRAINYTLTGDGQVKSIDLTLNGDGITPAKWVLLRPAPAAGITFGFSPAGDVWPQASEPQIPVLHGVVYEIGAAAAAGSHALVVFVGY